MVWGSLGLLAASSMLGKGVSSGMNYAFNAKLQQKQYDYQRKLNQQGYDLTQQGYREQYGNIRQGLENAGYNPLLALSGMSGPSFNGGSATGSSVGIDGSNLGDVVTNAKQQKSQDAVNRASVRQLDSQVGVNNAEANYKQGLLQSEIVKQAGYDLDNQIKDLQRQKERKELNIWDKKLLSELENIRNDTALKKAHSYQALMDATSSRIQANAATTNAKGNYYYNTHRALGFSTSESGSDSFEGGVKTPIYGHNRGKTSSYSRSTNW